MKVENVVLLSGKAKTQYCTINVNGHAEGPNEC